MHQKTSQQLSVFVPDRHCREAIVTFLLYNNAHHPAFAVVDDFLHGILKLGLTFFTDGGNLAADAVLYEFISLFHISLLRNYVSSCPCHN